MRVVGIEKARNSAVTERRNSEQDFYRQQHECRPPRFENGNYGVFLRRAIASIARSPRRGSGGIRRCGASRADAWRAFSGRDRAISAISFLIMAWPNDAKFSATMTNAPVPPTTWLR